jgi:chromosome segregation ATPase
MSDRTGPEAQAELRATCDQPAPPASVKRLIEQLADAKDKLAIKQRSSERIVDVLHETRQALHAAEARAREAEGERDKLRRAIELMLQMKASHELRSITAAQARIAELEGERAGLAERIRGIECIAGAHETWKAGFRDGLNAAAQLAEGNTKGTDHARP